jgi:hypothetical protein
MGEFVFIIRTVTTAMIEDGIGVVIIVGVVVAVRLVVNRYLR